MSEMGQTEKNSVRANAFQVTPESGHYSMQPGCLKGATSGLTRRSKLVVLFDDFVGLRKQRRRHREVEYLCGFQIDDQLERSRLLDGQIGGFGAFQNAVDGEGRATRQVRNAC